ncbi:MAG: hypothetical protein DRN27_09440 [Thermoplasmata archaeon]|nr:MAG: hypothetical protein DRN27_09440 [Thermoplasmata archaeon]
MEVFDFNKIKAHPYNERNKNVLHSQDNFKVRIIKLPPNGNMPQCEMKSSVIFYIIKGMAQVTIDKEQKIVKEGQCLITKPAMLSLRTEEGVKIMAVQIELSHKECA